MDSGLPRADEIISLNEAEALLQANLSSEFNRVVDDIGNALNKKITKLFEVGMRQHYINEITNFIKNELIDSTRTKQINKILALQTPAFQYTSPKKGGRSITSSSTRKRAKKGKRFNKTQKQLGGDYGLLTGVIKGPMARLEKVVKNKLSTYHIENAIGTGFYRAMGQAVFDENKLNLEVDNMLKKQLNPSQPLNFQNALIQARCSR